MDQSKQPTATFTVAFGDLKLSAEHKAAIQKAIQSAALAEIARLDLARDVRFRFPREWLGIWLQELKGSDPMPWSPNIGLGGHP